MHRHLGSSASFPRPWHVGRPRDPNVRGPSGYGPPHPRCRHHPGNGPRPSAVARLKGLLSATWLATGVATRIRTRALSAVIDSRPPAQGISARAVRRSWASLVLLSADALDEIRWWIGFLPDHTSTPIRPRPFDASVDGDIASDASDVGFGAVLTTRHGSPAASGLLRALAARAPAGLSLTALAEYVQAGIEFARPLPEYLLDASSTLRELFGIAEFIREVGPLLRGGRFRVFLDNLGCVFIMGGVVPESAIGCLSWGEYVTGGSPNPDLQRLAVQLFEAQLAGSFVLQAVWRPREENVRADFLSRVAAMLQHAYCLRPSLFRWLDERWGPHTIDRFASIDARQPLAPPHTGRFCSLYFHPEAAWVDAFSVRGTAKTTGSSLLCQRLGALSPTSWPPAPRAPLSCPTPRGPPGCPLSCAAAIRAPS